MKKIATIFFSMISLLMSDMPANTQESLWHELCARTSTLYQQGRYSEAVTTAEEAIQVAEKTFGKDHPAVAISLNNLH
jgi:hypothetical protein